MAQTTVGESEVSTVFLGLDHAHTRTGPRHLFETMIFGGPHDQYCDRYAMWQQAEAGHAETVRRLRAGEDPTEGRDG